jgi:type I restriction enzyme S subunit
VNLPPYPVCEKTSSAPWLGEVPADWQVKPLWTLFHRVKRTGYEEEQLLSVYRDYGVIPKSSRSDNFNKPSDDLSAYQLVCPNDLAINKMKAWQGSVAISGHRGIVSPAYFVYEPIHCENNRFLHYLLRSPRYIGQYLALSKGIRPNQWDLEPQLFSRLPVLVPPPADQSAIAVFLDAKTAVIDRLVRQQQLCLDLLAEKRQAIISHAVTKGLNPDAPLKPSGVEWAGPIPTHWRMVRLGYHGRVENGNTPSRQDERYWSSGTNAWVSSGDVNQYHIAAVSEFVTDLALIECGLRLLPKGTVLVGLVGQGKTRGTAASLAIDACINQNVAAVVLHGDALMADYLLYVFEAMYEFLRELGRGGNQPALNCEILRAIRLPIPPVDEQAAVCAHINLMSDEFNLLTTQVKRAIDLLVERRTALISAAVTGQIDVRGWTGGEVV